MRKNTILKVNCEAELLPFLLENLKGQSRNNIKSLLTYRQVSVDGKIETKHNFPLTAGMTVEILWSKSRENKHDTLDIIYEDEHIIAINKPAGLLSISNEKEKERTAYHMLTDYVKEKDKNSRIFVVHRLDRDTSGIFIVAKNEETKYALQDKWNDLVSRREYTAVVEGSPDDSRGTIKSRLRETRTHLVYSAETGDLAITNYEVVKPGKQYSLLRVQIATGRKNQIRVHMKDIGHPIAGDKKYGAKTSPIARLALHASLIELYYPPMDKMITLEAKTPHSFTKLVK